MSYMKRVCDNIVPLSSSSDCIVALREWYFTEETHDHEAPTETCELCDKAELRYHFKIQNKYNHNTLQVGSQCINKFDISVYDAGRELDKAEAKKKLARLVREMHRESCIKSLKRLSDSEESSILRNAVAFYEENDYLTPRYANVIFWKLTQYSINHSPSFFRISLKRQKYIDDLERLETWQVHRFWAALSSSQKKKAEELGHTPPAV
jgi:hypothetical protein